MSILIAGGAGYIGGAVAGRADAVIHAANTQGPDAGAGDAAATHAILRALDGTGRPFVDTSGAWVLGETGDVAADEASPLRPTPLVAPSTAKHAVSPPSMRPPRDR